jgi:hypothetical protein
MTGARFTRLLAPFTHAQVTALNRWQKSSTVHPFTCPDNHLADRTLVATKAGWVCPSCDYTQNWAHSFMLDEPPTLRDLFPPDRE